MANYEIETDEERETESQRGREGRNSGVDWLVTGQKT